MSEELSRVEDLLENGVEEPVLPMSELEAILRGEKVKPHSRVAELLLQYNPQDILIEKSITENGTYYASADNAAGYFKVIVDTPVIPPVVLDHLVETITENGTYNYTPEHDGYSDAEITVNVSSVQPVVASKTITANGTYVAADEQLDGYSQAVVNVPPTPLDTMNITHNGTYHPPTGRGFDEVNVTVPLGTKTITENGTYTATDDNLDGYSQVTINVAGGGGETKYYEYIRALNGQIIVRVEYPDAERTYAKQTLWFFNGYDTDSTDKDIPSILTPYLPKNWSTDVMMTSGYTDNTSATQLGWVGFLYPNQTPPSTKIRTWNIGKGGLQSGSFWGVLDISGPEEQITEWFDPYDDVSPSQIKILSNVPIQDNQGNWITYNFDTPLTVGKSYLIMWSSGKSVDTYPFATAFTLVNSSERVSLTAHGVTATLSISTTSLVGTYSNDYDTRLRHINLFEIPPVFSDGLIY